MSGVPSFQPSVVLHGDTTALVSDLTGQCAAEELQGFFAGDTRVLATYKIDINGCAWRLLARTRGHGSAQWHFQNPDLRDELGDVRAGLVSFTLRRRVAGALHDDLCIESFVGRPLRLRLILQLDADFADVFEVKSRSMPPRMTLLRVFDGDGVTLVHEGPQGFRRALHISVHCSDGTAPAFAGSRISLDVDRTHGQQWRSCVEAVPEIDGKRVAFSGDPHQQEPDPPGIAGAVAIDCVPLLKKAFERGQADLRALAMNMEGTPAFMAAGAPWFMSLFGRDCLVTALMTGIDGSGPGEGALAALGRLQGTRRDDFRDEEPGKIPHELRRGVKIGEDRLDITVARDGQEAVIETMEAAGVEAIRSAVEAPLGGLPGSIDGRRR